MGIGVACSENFFFRYLLDFQSSSPLLLLKTDQHPTRCFVSHKKQKRTPRIWPNIKQMLRWQITPTDTYDEPNCLMLQSGCCIWWVSKTIWGFAAKSGKWQQKYMSSLINPADTQSQCEISWEELFLSFSLYLTPTHTSINRKESANESIWVVCALWKEQSVLSSKSLLQLWLAAG